MNSKPIVTLDTMFIVNHAIEVADIDGEKAMIDMNTGKYYMLNEVGSSIWGYLQKKRSVREMIELLMKEYDVTFDLCEEQVISFLEEIYRDELIYICE